MPHAIYIPVYASSSFSWKDNHGSTEASTLNQIARLPSFGRDGIYIKSNRTDECLFFEPVFDEDGYDGEFAVFSAEVALDKKVFVTIAMG